MKDMTKKAIKQELYTLLPSKEAWHQATQFSTNQHQILDWNVSDSFEGRLSLLLRYIRFTPITIKTSPSHSELLKDLCLRVQEKNIQSLQELETEYQMQFENIDPESLENFLLTRQPNTAAAILQLQIYKDKYTSQRNSATGDLLFQFWTELNDPKYQDQLRNYLSRYCQNALEDFCVEIEYYHSLTSQAQKEGTISQLTTEIPWKQLVHSRERIDLLSYFHRTLFDSTDPTDLSDYYPSFLMFDYVLNYALYEIFGAHNQKAWKYHIGYQTQGCWWTLDEEPWSLGFLEHAERNQLQEQFSSANGKLSLKRSAS